MRCVDCKKQFLLQINSCMAKQPWLHGSSIHSHVPLLKPTRFQGFFSSWYHIEKNNTMKLMAKPMAQPSLDMPQPPQPACVIAVIAEATIISGWWYNYPSKNIFMWV